MNAWWQGLTTLQQILYCIAVPSTAILLIQTILMLIGFGGHTDVGGTHGAIGGGVGHDIPNDAVVLGRSTFGHGGVVVGAQPSTAEAGHPQGGGHTDQADVAAFRLITFRGVLAFLVVFGWSGIAMASGGASEFVILLVAFAVGLAALVLTAWMFFALQKLQDRGNIELKNAVGHDAEVYIPVPAAGNGQGKVNLLLQERWIECDAVTLGLESLKTKRAVRVVGVQGGSVLVVEPIQK